MTNPNSDTDEQIILDSSSISIKGVKFRVILTNYRIALYNFSTQKQNDITLTEVQKVKAESGLVGDPTILLFIISQSGENKKMIFNFSSNQENERDQWVTEINNLILSNSGIPSNGIAGYPVNSYVSDQQSDTFFCSKCGNKVTDGSSFCNRCGTKISPPAQPMVNYQNDGKVKYAGESSKISTEKITLPARKTQYADANIPYIKSKESRNISLNNEPVAKKFNFTLPTISNQKPSIAALCCGGIILLIVISAIFSAIGSNSSNHSSASPTSTANSYSQSTTTRAISDSSEQIVSKSFSEIALTINDLPNGWMVQGTPIVTDDQYVAEFLNINVGSTAIKLNFSITKYPTIDKAKKEYISKKSQVTNVKVNPITAGDEGFAYQDIVDTSAIFRKGNLIVSISTTYYPAVPIAYVTPYADKISNRI
jgi:hypothetical protein